MRAAEHGADSYSAHTMVPVHRQSWAHLLHASIQGGLGDAGLGASLHAPRPGAKSSSASRQSACCHLVVRVCC